MNYNLRFYIQREKGKEDGRLRLRLKWDNSRVDALVGFRVAIDKWEAQRQRCKNNTSHGKKKISASIINAELSHIEQLVADYFDTTEAPSADELRTLLKGKRKQTPQGSTLFDHYDEFINYGISAHIWTRPVLSRHKLMRKTLLQMDPQMGYSFFNENGFVKLINVLLAGGMSNTTIKHRIKVLKVFLRWAEGQHYHTNDFYRYYTPRLKTIPKRVIFLRWAELLKLYDFQFPQKHAHLEKVRDAFCLCCFTSLRWSDVCALKKAHISNGTISIVTKKTYEPLRIELNKYSSAILAKYADDGSPYALPTISNVKANKYLKEIGELVGLNEPITESKYVGGKRIDEEHPKWELLSTHAGRRTFICNSLMMGIPVDIVMKWTGHSDYKAMRPYIDIADEAKKSAMHLFDER